MMRYVTLLCVIAISCFAITGCASKARQQGETLSVHHQWHEIWNRKNNTPLLEENGVMIIHSEDTWKRMWTFSFRDPMSGETEIYFEAPDVDWELHLVIVCYHFGQTSSYDFQRLELIGTKRVVHFRAVPVEDSPGPVENWYQVHMFLIDKIPDNTDAEMKE